MSPHLELEVEDVCTFLILIVTRLSLYVNSLSVYNEATQKICLNVSQKFHIFASPLSAATAK
jgi:hypothetical protein